MIQFVHWQKISADQDVKRNRHMSKRGKRERGHGELRGDGGDTAHGEILRYFEPAEAEAEEE